MAAPDPEGMSMAAKVITALVAVVGPVWGARTWLEKRLDKKADKHAVYNAVNELKLELGTQRGHIGKIFDQMRENEQKSEQRHRELMMHMLERGKQ